MGTNWKRGALAGFFLFGSATCGMEPVDPADIDVSPLAEFAPSGCPEPPPGMAPAAYEAIEAVNRTRKLADLGCVELVPEINIAAEQHCQYYMSNTGACTSNPHREKESCTNFTAETFSDRLRRHKYPGDPRFEVMAYVGSGQVSVQQWLDSVWHRLPILSPEVDQAGYGAWGRCDTMDFGYGRGGPTQRNIVYPIGGQTEVPLAFYGRESPEPPPPPTGWPSGYPITLYAAGMKATAHRILNDETGEELDHIWLPPGDRRAYGLLIDEFMAYTWEPLRPNTRYRVVIEGVQHGEPKVFDWTFTTR